MARGYVYRAHNAKVIGIADDCQMVGVALVKEMDEAPACYDLQQFMIDKRYQNKGFGTEALKLILSQLCREGKYNCVEVCVNKADISALHVYEKAGFIDTGYIDDDVPDCLNLMYYFK
ncbi:MAG: GNAT family protein [Clostridiaceae bacterium]|nr:GNAT family protein [Clostridiaceae bacterium]